MTSKHSVSAEALIQKAESLCETKNLRKAMFFARHVKVEAVWSKVANALHKRGMIEEASAYFVMARHPHYYSEEISRNSVWRMKGEKNQGLMYMNNNCFANAALQLLASIPSFAQIAMAQYRPELALKDKDLRKVFVYYSAHLGQDGQNRVSPTTTEAITTLLREYDVLRMILEYRGDIMQIVSTTLRKILNVNGREKNTVFPVELVGSLKEIGPFKFGQQNDAHEFLNSLLGAVKSTSQSNDDMVTGIFGGKLGIQLRCRNCGRKAKRAYETFEHLSLSIKGVTTVKDALMGFLRNERVDRRCNKCLGEEAVKYSSIYEAPNALVISLKIFDYSRMTKKNKKPPSKSRMARKTKIKIHIEETLEVPVSGPEASALYNLTGVIERLGSSDKHGHFVTFRKTPDNRWIKADDDKVSKVDTNTLARVEPYVLVYTKNQGKTEEAPTGPWVAFSSWCRRAFKSSKRFCERLLPRGEGCRGLFGSCWDASYSTVE